MKNIKACIFDLDGTLTDTINAIAHFGNLALTTFGMKALPTENYKLYAGDGRDTLIHRILKASNNDTEEMFKCVRKVYDKNYEKDYIYDTDAFDGIRNLLDELKKRNIKLAVCSNKPDNVVHFVIDSIFGEGYFEEVCGIIDGMKTKPNPETALKIAKLLGVKPDECLFIGDTNVDILTAKNANMTSVGVLWGFRAKEELVTAGADFIVDKPHKILDITERN